MELVAIKIKGIVVTSRYGTLSSGDVLRTDAAFAKHLVEECQAGEYLKPQPAEASNPAAKSAGKGGKKAKAAPQKDEASQAKVDLQAAIAELETQLAAAEEADKPALAEQLAAKQQELAALTE